MPGLPRKYCMPDQKHCWPNATEIEKFSISINGTHHSCLGLQKFISMYDNEAQNNQSCLPYNGLLNNISRKLLKDGQYVGGDHHVCNLTSEPRPQSPFVQPDPNCNANPFITEANYESPDDEIACMTPYQFLNNRNYKSEWMAAYIVTAESPDDVSKAIKFANNHNLGIAVMSTGHDLQDRNAGPAPNSLLIRTTCLNSFDVSFKNITGYDGIPWTEGYATVGAGLTFGQNYWWNMTNEKAKAKGFDVAKGLYPLAAQVNREIVGGTCHSVGIVGWTLGGGKGWTTPLYGLGVDQLLHVDMVTPSGDIVYANFKHNKDLFWAIRGGGAGFGVITSMKIKLHEPSCKLDGNRTMNNCYSVWTASWVGAWNGGAPLPEIKNVLKAMLNWTANYSHTWNSLIDFHMDKQNKNFSLSITSKHFGTNKTDPTNFYSFKNTFQNLNITNAFKKFNGYPVEDNQPPIITNKYWCELFPDPDNGNNCTVYPVVLQRRSSRIRFLVNSNTTLNPDFLHAMLNFWQPMCDTAHQSCSSGFQLHYFFPSGHGPNNGGAIKTGFRNAATQVFNLGIKNDHKKLTFEEQETWMHYTLGPAMYKFSDTSYFNEAEYTLDPGQWEERFWGKDIHCELLRLKKKYDPKFLFNCRHCVGNEVGTEPGQ